jgi:hypothetical protein
VATVPNHRIDTVVTIVEANLSLIDANTIAQTVGAAFQRFGHRGPIVHMHHSDSITGVMTTHDVKEQMMRNLERMLFDNQVCFDSRFSSATPGKTSSAVLNMLLDEMASFRRVPKESVDPKTNVRRITSQLTGKVDGGNDDMIMVLMMLAYWPRVFKQDARYSMHWIG